jgi:flagellar FliL protein
MTAEAEIEEGAAAPGKKSKMKLIIIAAAAVVVLAAGAGTFMFMSASSHTAEEAAHADAAKVPTSFVFNLPTMTVNLNSEGGAESFMRLTIALEVADQEMMTTIQPKMAKVIDAFQVYLRELRRSDLEGSAGIYRLKEELLRRVNLAIAPASVESILFKEILVQ